MHKPMGAVLLAALLLAAAQLAWSVEIEPCAAEYDEQLKSADPPGVAQVWPTLSSEMQSGCILGATDSTGIRQLYLNLQRLPPGGDLAVARTQLFDRVLAQFDGIASSVCDGDSTACVVGRHVEAIRNARELLSRGHPNTADPRLSTSAWGVVVSTGSIGVSEVSLQPYLTHECAEGAGTAPCRSAVDIAAKILRSSEAMFQAIVAHRMPIIEANEAFLSTRDKEWNSYFNEVSVQYPWELALNGWRFQQKTPPPERAGFPRAPEQKLIALHPLAAFEYAETSGGEHSTQAAAVVELVGYERWRWRDGKAVNRVGMSLAASFTDSPGADAVGYGLVFHTPVRNISIGAVWRDGDHGDSINLIFNVNLAALIQQYKNADVKDFVGVLQPAAATGQP
jgi:hypothetical protein